MLLQTTKKRMFALLIVFLGVASTFAQTNRVLNNNRLRIGTGNENSINSAGNMQQPFYYNGSTYRKLTYSIYPLDIRWGIGGDGTNGWNTNGAIVENPALANQTFDYSGFTVTNTTTGDGYGQIITTGEITTGGQQFRIENTYELLQPEGYIAIKVKITNIGTSSASNVRLWVGTRDDYVGGSDIPTKERGNLVNQEFEGITNQTEQAKAIKISTTEEAILFFSNSDRAYSTISGCCNFSNATSQNPATNVTSATGDGSYALYVRFNDLAVNESDELIWYYGAGTLPEIDEIIERVANAAIGAFDNITFNSADYAATTVESGTGYWVLVPDGSTAPTEAQIKSAVDYNGVSIIASGNAAMTANQEEVFNLIDLEAFTDYDFYFVSEYFDGVSDAYTEIIDENLLTLEAPPILTDFNPKTAAFGETITITGSNFITTSDILIGGLNGIFTVIDANTIEVTVPQGAEELFITVTNESGTTSIESEVDGNTSAGCNTGWTNSWQTITTEDAGNLRTATLKLGNTSNTNAYDLFLELHETDGDPLSANPNTKFNSLKASSETLTVAANSPEAEVTFTFNTSNELEENTNYYVVLKESATNPVGTGEQTISIECAGSGTTDGGAGNNFGTLFHSFTVSPILQISNPPTAISLTPNLIQENNAINAIVGELSSTDADTDDTHSYAFISGTGDNDNLIFTISGTDLLANEKFDYETKASYTIRVLTSDSDGNVHEEAISITVQDNIDEDGDGIADTSDNCPESANADQLDTDSDGDGDMCDNDDDDDGTPDTEDAFPLDENEDTDTDNDGTGDNADTDDDNDGTPDTDDAFPKDANEDTDTDNDGTGDNADTDDDGDGTPDTEDDFPLDENEDTDTDSDGTGDNADTDDDNDGTTDTDDAFPKDANENTDTDGDGTGDNADDDSDNDGVPDSEDAFPLDPNEQIDSDGDGIGDNGDTDDDNDGVEDIDTDGDGTGDNVDTDDDNDGMADNEDAFPTDPDETLDTDGDGIGDNTDEDDDNDGYSDAVENELGTNSKDANSNPKDTDNDGIPDSMDDDDDNDGVADALDNFPTEDEPLLRPAEAFTPNGDGNNDTWVIPGIDNYTNATVSVYNRWGHEVFIAINYRNDWNGNHGANSKKLPPGSYLYVIDLGNGNAPLKGWIFINY